MAKPAPARRRAWRRDERVERFEELLAPSEVTSCFTRNPPPFAFLASTYMRGSFMTARATR